jgi:hypothetical protein
MQVFAVMSPDGATPMQMGVAQTVPDGAVYLGEGSDLSPWADKLFMGGQWGESTPLPEPKESLLDSGYELAFPAVPVGAVVRVFHIEAALMVVDVVVLDGVAEVLLPDPGTYSVEIRAPAPVRFWSKVVSWSA